MAESRDNHTKHPLAERLEGLDVAHLELLADMTQSFASSLEIDETLRIALRKTMEYLHAEGGSIFLLVDDDQTLECRASMGPVSITGLRLGADQGIVGRAVQSNETLMIRDVSSSHNFNVAVDEDTGFLTRSVLCAPLTVRGQRLGALELINKQGDDGLFNERDRSFLTALASSAALAMLNARMAADLVEQEKVRKELEMARDIQRSLLPPDPEPWAPIHAINIPARSVSGDLYLFFELADGRSFFALGDVSGKGVHAALFMAQAASLIRALAKMENRPGKLLARLNEDISETASRGMFITLVAGVYDPVTERVCLSNAGHEPPLYRSRDGEYTAYPASAPPLGILPDISLSEVELQLDGGSIYIFTDGLTEGFTQDGSQFGIDGVKGAIEQYTEALPQQRLESMIAPLIDGDRPLRDDITLLLLEAESGPLAATIEARPLPESLKELREELRSLLQGWGLDRAIIEQMVLAVGEGAMNIVQHGFDGGDAGGRISLEVEHRGNELRLRLLDSAPPAKHEEIRSRDLKEIRPGGLGIHFIREIMDRVEFLPAPEGWGNLLEMHKRVD